ncbi:hypothetical protein BOX15_Mlig010622g1, partial [Macrostomum lignano]
QSSQPLSAARQCTDGASAAANGPGVSSGDGAPSSYSYNDKLNPIGAGSFSKVYIGQGPHGRVAVKLVQWCSSGGVNYGSLRELSTLKRLQRCQHPNVLKLLDVFVSELNQTFCQHLVFELMDCDLRQLMRARGDRPLEVPLVASLGRQLLSGLAHLHRHRMLHRDIKPQNLLLDWSATVLKIADFNSSRLCSWERCLSRVATTLAYRAPEALLSASYGTPADVWSTGCIFYEMLTGLWPFPCCKKGEAPTLSCIAACVVEGLTDPLLPIADRSFFESSPPWLIIESVKHAANCPPLRSRLASAAATPDALLSEPNGPMDLLRRMLSWRPTDRPTAAEALDSSVWLACEPPPSPHQNCSDDDSDNETTTSSSSCSTNRSNSDTDEEDNEDDSDSDEASSVASESSLSSWLTCSDSDCTTDDSASDCCCNSGCEHRAAANEVDYADYIGQRDSDLK